MKRLYALLVFALFSGCYQGPVTPEPSLEWREITPVDFPSSIGDWDLVECYPGDYEKTDGGQTITMGSNGYSGRCLFASESFSLLDLPDGTEIRLTLYQRSGPFKNSELPFWSHLWVLPSTSGSYMSDAWQEKIFPMYLQDRRETDPTATFTSSAHTRVLRVAVGFDPSFVVWTNPKEQPAVEFRRLKIEALLPSLTGT